MKTSTTINAIFTDAGNTDNSRHQIEIDPAVRLTTAAGHAEIGGDSIWTIDTTARGLAHEIGHLLGLPNAYDQEDRDSIAPWLREQSDEQ